MSKTIYLNSKIFYLTLLSQSVTKYCNTKLLLITMTPNQLLSTCYSRKISKCRMYQI